MKINWRWLFAALVVGFMLGLWMNAAEASRLTKAAQAAYQAESDAMKKLQEGLQINRKLVEQVNVLQQANQNAAAALQNEELRVVGVRGAISNKPFPTKDYPVVEDQTALWVPTGGNVLLQGVLVRRREGGEERFVLQVPDRVKMGSPAFFPAGVFDPGEKK